MNSSRKPTNSVGKTSARGFTIVELLIVAVVIAILAAITIVAYQGITAQANESSLQTELGVAAKQLETDKIQRGGAADYRTNYADAGVVQPADTTYTYTPNGDEFCLQVERGGATYYVSNEQLSPTAGACPPAAVAMQTVTNASCSTTRTLAYDARDDRSYWIQKLADGECWMLTNLAYAGGGDNTYADTMSLTNNGAGSASNSAPYYYIPSGSNATDSPAEPSTSTDGTGQYGYLYNWCAAMGGQLGTVACLAANTPVANTSVSICPAGWRLPGGYGDGNHFQALNDAINSGDGSNDSGMRSAWLMQYGGNRYSSFYGQGTQASYWTRTHVAGGSADYMYFAPSVSGFGVTYYDKVSGQAVRCIAS